jgi:hypothetical protein
MCHFKENLAGYRAEDQSLVAGMDSDFPYTSLDEPSVKGP